MDKSSAEVARERTCSTQGNLIYLKMHPQAYTHSSEWLFCELCLVLFALYLSMGEERTSELRQVTTGLQGLLKLTSDVVLARTRNSLMGSRQQDMYSKYKVIFVVTCLLLLVISLFM